MARKAQADGGIDISHVCKITRPARKQYLTSHNARAVELYERAIAAAEALRQPDCLIVARLRCWWLDTLFPWSRLRFRATAPKMRSAVSSLKALH